VDHALGSRFSEVAFLWASGVCRGREGTPEPSGRPGHRFQVCGGGQRKRPDARQSPHRLSPIGPKRGSGPRGLCSMPSPG